MYRIITCVALLFLLLPQHMLKGQGEKNFSSYDKETYRLYQEASWKSLMASGKEALDAGYDFYYLRLRLGIAAYSLGKYRTAILHFNKALAFNSAEPLAIEYLYYAYVFAGRLHDANLVWESYHTILENRDIKSPLAFIAGLYTEGGVKLSSENETGVGNITNFHLGISHQFDERIFLYQGYTRVSQAFTVPITGRPPGMTWEQTYRYTQDEYYLKAGIPVVRGLQIAPSFHSQSYEDSLGNPVRNRAFTLGMIQNSKLFDIYLGFGASRINLLDQRQYMTSLTCYPLGNSNLYLQTSYTLHQEEAVNSSILSAKIGSRILGKTWLEGYGSLGGTRHFQEYEGFYMYNYPTTLNYRWGLTLSTYLGAKSRILTGYILENKELRSETAQSFNHHYVFLGLFVNFKTR